MMKHPLTLLILLLSVSTFGQFQRFESCEEAENMAIKDFRDGYLVNRIHGLVDIQNPEFEKFYELYLYSKYNIKTSFEGCMVSEIDLCYTNKMDELIKEKFGDNFYDRTWEKLQQDLEELSESEKAEILNLEKAYTDHLDSYPKFIGNDSKIREYIKSISKTEKGAYFYFATLKIDTNGNIIDFSLDNNAELNNESNYQNYLREINELGKWIPAYIYDEKVIAEIPFLFK